ALDLAWVAAGRADACFEAGLKPWDIAAGALLVREAGGMVCDYRGRGTPRMDATGPDTRPLMAANVKIGPLLQQRLVSTGYAATCAASGGYCALLPNRRAQWAELRIAPDGEPAAHLESTQEEGRGIRGLRRFYRRRRQGRRASSASSLAFGIMSCLVTLSAPR